ncbi:MAG: inner rane hydrolase [Verrucomicrobiaceae bacterium]|nr:inner rane hydrolase [Verrucomicrobiaceae bacterium]
MTASKLPLRLFFALTWVHMLWQTLPFFKSAAPAADWSLAFSFHLLAWLSYSVIYLLPAAFISTVAQRFSKANSHTPIVIAIIASALTLLLVRIDRSIYDLYNFHFNGFVLNLILTPGGVESLGGDSDSYISSALLVIGIFITQCALMFVAISARLQLTRRTTRSAVVVFAIAIVLTQALYGIGDLRSDGAVVGTADTYPLFLRVRFRKVGTLFGFKTAKHAQLVSAKVDSSRLHYPLQPMKYDGAVRPLNIVWLVAESLRWDQLDAEIMPNSFAFAQQSLHFMNHYSSGNGTREGLFGMFYGLYGSYWDNFLHANQGPLLIDRLQALNYQMDLRTSARFSYPEFDKTLFARVPKQFLHEDEFNEDAAARDRSNTSALIDFINKRDVARPFLTFLFFESTHARYTFPDEAIIRKPYLEKLNYADMTRENLAPYADQLRNRYSNSAHWVDMQLGRIYQSLREQNLLDSTVVIVTGDHGEEFMEKGFWGHNSSFVEQQTHTPMIVSMPGEAPRTIERTTSHMDIAVTLMQLLGASNDIGDYALGRNLLDESPRDFIVISDWHSINVNAGDFKYRIPYTSRGIENYKPTHRDDSPFASSEEERLAIEKNQKVILEAVKNISKFAK